MINLGEIPKDIPLRCVKELHEASTGITPPAIAHLFAFVLGVFPPVAIALAIAFVVVFTHRIATAAIIAVVSATHIPTHLLAHFALAAFFLVNKYP